MRKTPLALAALLAAPIFAAPALADEAWETNLGYVIWEDTQGDDAILRLFTGEGTSGPETRMIVPGLGADMGGGRGSYHGVWVSVDSDVPCATQMIDPVSNAKTPYWGSFILTFVGDSFPSDWAGVYGNCLETPNLPMQAHALVGEERNRAP